VGIASLNGRHDGLPVLPNGFQGIEWWGKGKRLVLVLFEHQSYFFQFVEDFVEDVVTFDELVVDCGHLGSVGGFKLSDVALCSFATCRRRRRMNFRVPMMLP
jgi:hypothetical protein